ncbi:MAG TPA: MATE family efflux transporter, partial [Polyangiaceae bacterium]|nr:MATE family efflux transporter [Polyangiaceae bacterium]
PIVLSRATQSVIGFCDALMLAPLGETALAAGSTGALNTFAWIILPMGTVFILQSFAAQLRGRGDLESLPRFGWYGLVLAVASGVLALTMIPALPRLLGLFDYEPDVERLMIQYMGIRLFSVAPAVATEALGNWYGGLGNTRIAMLAGLASMVTNVAGNFLLIEPRFGLPGYGVAGAAWASVLATFVGLSVVLTVFLRGVGYEKPAKLPRLRAGELLRVVRFGLPNGVNWFLEFAAFMLFVNVVVAHLGTTVLAALNVVMQINSIAFMPAFGLSSAGAILVGEAIGRRAHGEVWPIVRRTGAIALGWMGTVALAYALVPEFFFSWFSPKRAEEGLALATVGATMLVLSSTWQLFDATAMTFGEALRAAGDTTWCMAARIVLAWLVFTPVGWAAVFVFDGGVVAVMVSMAGYMGLLALALAARFASGRWRNIDLVGEPSLV